MADILSKAGGLVSGDRRSDYVHPLDDFGATGKIWGAILSLRMGIPIPAIPAEVVGLMMIGLKLARESGRHKEDNLVDMAGYTQCVENVLDEKAKRALNMETFGPVTGSAEVKFTWVPVPGWRKLEEAAVDKPQPSVGEEIPHKLVPECYGTQFGSNSTALLWAEFGCADCTAEPECNPARRDRSVPAAQAAAVWFDPLPMRQP